MNNTTVDVRSDDGQFREMMTSDSTFHHHHLSSTLQINHKMSASNDKLLFEAARDGKLEVVKELLSKGTGTGYRDEVS
jgi:hypothetical protein